MHSEITRIAEKFPKKWRNFQNFEQQKTKERKNKTKLKNRLMLNDFVLIPIQCDNPSIWIINFENNFTNFLSLSK